MKQNDFFCKEINHYEKITPQCKYFGECGGCFMQNVSYKHQLEIKYQFVCDTLLKIANVSSDLVKQVHPSLTNFFYRNKMEFAFGEIENNVILGLRRSGAFDKKDQQRIVHLEKCLIATPLIEKIFPFFTEFANKNNYKPFNRLTHTGFFRHLVIREGKLTNQLMLILVTTRGDMPLLKEFVESIVNNIPEIQSFYRVTNDRVADIVDYEKLELIFGQAYIIDQIGNLSYKIYPDTFFQVNNSIAENLYLGILNYLNLSEVNTLLGLYCGSGGIEIFLAQYFKEVIGIDSNPSNIRSAKENLILNKINNCTFLECRAEDSFDILSNKNIDAIVVDPPRAGLSKKAISNILALSPSKIVYISCNPITFSENIIILKSKGYSLLAVEPFDFFPHTKHIELLGILIKN